MPLNINLLSDDTIARGITPPDVGNLASSFAGVQDYAQKQQLQNLFSGGLPRDAQGNIDYNRMAEALARVQGAGAIPTLTALRQADIQQQAITGLDQTAPQIFGQPQQTLPPSIQRTVPSAPRQTSSVEPPAQGVVKPPGQNLTDGETISETVDGQPVARSFAPVASTDSRYPPEFGPTPERFTQVAQAQQARQPQEEVPPPPAQSPVPPGSPGFFTEENAAAYEQSARRANYMATRVGLGGAAIAPAAARLGQQAQQYFDAAKQIRDQMAKISEEREKSRLKVGAVMPEEAAKQSVTQMSESRKKAESFAEGIPATQNLLDQINSKAGIFTGKWAGDRLVLAKIGQVVGVPDDRVMSTEAYQALVGRKVAQTVKSFGSGTSITNQDREYATKMEGGEISLNEDSIRKILTLSDQVGRDVIRNHNRDVTRIQRAYPQSNLDNFKVEEPAALQGRTTQPKPGPQGAIPPAPAPQQRQPDQIYMTPKGPAHWRGTGWELVK